MNYEFTLSQIKTDPRYLVNLDWGEVRSGHPEGPIRAHIAELEQNLERLRLKLTDEDCQKLLVLIHTHDTFKPNAKQGVSITDPRSHASLAREFLAEFCLDEDLLAMVQFHDEPYALWRKFGTADKLDEARLASFRAAISDWNLFLAFLIIDGCTVGKSRAPLEWFCAKVAERSIADKVQANFTAADIISP